jgi:agmatine/peptidylarginine deiminase
MASDLGDAESEGKHVTRILKIFVVSCAGLLLLLAIFAAVAAAIFLRQLEFETMEAVSVVDTATRSLSNSIRAERVRAAAEWEPALGVLVGWPLLVPESLVVEIAKDDTLFLMVEDEEAKAEAEQRFRELAMDLGKVEFILAEAGDNQPWTRDWGAFASFSETKKLSLVDPWFDDYPWSGLRCDSPLYSERRLLFEDFSNDDLATEVLANTLDFPSVRIPVALTGGNVMMDGHGTAFSTCVMLNENRGVGVGEDEFYGVVREHLGISRYVLIPNFEIFGIQHIDCFLKLLDEETILVARPPRGHSHYERSEAIVQELSSLTNAYGRPYKIIRIETPPYWLNFMPAYTNSLILNRKIFVPLYGIPADQAALETWRRAMPGYQVIGFEHHADWLEGWMWFDALHCRTRAIWDPEMLYMTHRRIDESMAPAETYPIEVQIRDYSQAGLIHDSLELSWRLRGGEPWQVILLQASPDPEIFLASIPGAAAGQTVEYFLSAADRSGRRESLPRTAPEGYYSFTIVSEQ